MFPGVTLRLLTKQKLCVSLKIFKILFFVPIGYIDFLLIYLVYTVMLHYFIVIAVVSKPKSCIIVFVSKIVQDQEEATFVNSLY